MVRANSSTARKTCYACDKPAINQEHAPPASFFPPGRHDSKLIKVPSCKAHNNDHSKDVEYVRNVLVCASDLNAGSEPVFDKMMRSFNYRPTLIGTTFDELRPYSRNGEETAAFTVNLLRFKRVMTAVAQALHYRDMGEKIRYWDIFCPVFQSDQSLSGQPDPYERLRRATSCGFNYAYRPVEYPSVFSYGSAPLASHRGPIYQFVFYEAVIVNAWPFKRQLR